MSRRFFYMTLAYHFLAFYFLAFSLSYAETCQDGRDYIETQSDYCYDYRGCFSTVDEAASAMGTYYTSGASAHVIGTVTAYLKYEYQGNGCSSYYAVYAVVNPALVDTDGDGLLDECDFYPNDSTPYSVKLMTYFTDDGTASGSATFQVWQTDRGDLYQVGEEPTDLNSGFYVGGQSAWSEPECGSELVSGPVSPSDPNKVISQPAVSTGTPTGDAPADTDPTLQAGQKSTGTETDNEALKGIMDNTGDIAGNTKRMGEYMRNLNAAIQNMDRNAIIANERAEAEALEKKQQEVEAENAKTDFENFDVEGALGEQIDPTITEGPDGDYQEHGPLSEETWVTEFISANPITNVLEQSGFHYSNSNCTADLDLGYLGQHSINICALEDGFIAFGNLLVALTTLTGLIHVVTGRGF